jgi:hypothetical protein
LDFHLPWKSRKAGTAKDLINIKHTVRTVRMDCGLVFVAQALPFVALVSSEIRWEGIPEHTRGGGGGGGGGWGGIGGGGRGGVIFTAARM